MYTIVHNDKQNLLRIRSAFGACIVYAMLFNFRSNTLRNGIKRCKFQRFPSLSKYIPCLRVVLQSHDSYAINWITGLGMVRHLKARIYFWTSIQSFCIMRRCKHRNTHQPELKKRGGNEVARFEKETTHQLTSTPSNTYGSCKLSLLAVSVPVLSLHKISTPTKTSI